MLMAQNDVSMSDVDEKFDLRIPKESKIEDFRADKHFQYDQEYARPPQIPKWLWNILDYIIKPVVKTIDFIFTSGVMKIVLIVLVTALVVVIIMRLQGVTLKSLLGKQKMENDQTQFIAEDVNAMNFDELINQSLDDKNYRLVVRFLYLKNLKLLSDKAIIEWNPNKTNYSYESEIRSEQIRSGFRNTTRIFDFVWYGEFILNEDNFGDAYNYFKEFNQLVENER